MKRNCPKFIELSTIIRHSSSAERESHTLLGLLEGANLLLMAITHPQLWLNVHQWTQDNGENNTTLTNTRPHTYETQHMNTADYASNKIDSMGERRNVIHRYVLDLQIQCDSFR